MQLQARCKQKRNREKKKISFPVRSEKTSRKEMEKEVSNGKDAKVQVGQESQINQSAHIFQKEQCQNKSTSDHWHQPECSHTSNQKVDEVNATGTIAIIGRNKGIQLCMEWRPYNCVLSTIDTGKLEGNQQRSMSQYGKTLP